MKIDKKIEEIAMFVAEVIENGYKVEKGLKYLKETYGLNEVQVSNIEELITNFNKDYDGTQFENDEDWNDFVSKIINAVK